MFAELLLAYLELGRSGTGLTVLGLISLLCCGAVVFWAYRDPDIQRRAVLIAAGVLTAVVIGMPPRGAIWKTGSRSLLESYFTQSLKSGNLISV